MHFLVALFCVPCIILFLFFVLFVVTDACVHFLFSPNFHDGARRSAWEIQKWWPLFLVFNDHVSNIMIMNFLSVTRWAGR